MEGKSGLVLDAYIPVDRRLALASAQPLPAKGYGAVLFADISGFTLLTGDLTRELGDQRGADEITRYLNLIYDALISRIHQYQGSVISFAGDAITCWFNEDEGLRAMAAGSNMQSAIRELVQKHQIPVQIKIVIATGPINRYVVGDPNVQLMDLIAGKTVSRVIAGEKVANPGDLLISDEVASLNQSFYSSGKSVYAANGDRFTQVTALTAEIPATPWQIDTQLPAEILSQWLLSPVYEKIRHGEDNFLAELRLTVCLFLKFDGIDYDLDPESGQKINHFISWVQACLIRHDGHLLQVIIGDKGDYLYIGFGALAAHEDDPSRAIAAAQMLRQPPDSLAFITGIQIGITQGRMLAGPYGSSTRRTYSMLGANANLAARLMEHAAPGQILMSERVAIAAQKQFLFDPLGAVRLKGIEQAVPVFALMGHQNVNRNIQLSQTPLVGRLDELEEILQYARQINHTNEPGIILLQGEGGIGKSRLLSELMLQIHQMDITVLSSFGYEIENSTPYFVVRDLFRQLFRVDQLSSGDLLKLLLAIIKDINPDWERLMPLLSEILPLELPDNELTAQMYGDIRASNLHTLLVGIFRKISLQKSFLIILDDAHWLDSASWALLNELFDVSRNTGLIISCRPFTSDPPKDYLKLIGNRRLNQIQLANFHRPDIEKLVCQVLGSDDLPPDVLALIYDKASGHPFFSEELAYALVASGILVVENGHCRFSQNLMVLDELTVPDTIQSAITSRLDHMSTPQQLTLKVASILGRLFVLKAVKGIHPSPPDAPALQEQVNAMTGMNLIALQVIEPEPAYSFKQTIIHDVAYNMLSYTQRHELHQKAACWYEKTFAHNLSQYYPQLGYHWLQAEVYDKAADYLEKAAFDAIGKGAWRDGIVFIRQTLALETLARIPVRRKAILLIEMGIAYFKTGELQLAAKQLQNGIRTFKYPAPTSLPALGFNLLRQASLQVVYRLRSPFSPSLTDQEREVRIILSRAYEYLAQSYFHHNDLFFSLDASLSGLNAAESAGPSAQLARAYASLCITTGTMPIPGLSEEYARLAQSLLTNEVSLNDHGRILELIAVAWSGKGRWADIGQLCSQALVMANEIGDRFLVMENTCILAACLLPQGKPEESVKLREELYQIGVQDKVELVQGWALLQLAEIALMKQEYSNARDLLVTAASVEHALGQPDRLWLHGLQAAAFALLGDLDSARKSAVNTLNLSSQSLPTSFFVLEGYSGMLTAFLALADARPGNKEIAKLTSKALKAFARYAASFPIGQPRLLFWRGILALRKGHSVKAVKFWRAGLARAKQLGMVYESARIEKALGK
jgi:class 3 adenylate cyclase/tetratricopeptide (TPR) repeat protein